MKKSFMSLRIGGSVVSRSFPQRLKPVIIKVAYRSAEALRHPKASAKTGKALRHSKAQERTVGAKARSFSTALRHE
jgi:hypothetical protein